MESYCLEDKNRKKENTCFVIFFQKCNIEKKYLIYSKRKNYKKFIKKSENKDKYGQKIDKMVE